jgi:hypothetical protein
MSQHHQNLHTIIFHKGPLTMASLDASIKGSIFRPAKLNSKLGKKDTNADPLQMGWEFIPPVRPIDFILQDLEFVTAEGVVTLAALVECLRNRCQCEVNVKIGSKGREWSDALFLEQLISNKWLSSLPIQPIKVNDNWAYPIWRYNVNRYIDCKRTADRISDQVERFLRELNYFLVEDVAIATKAVFTEALLNILEHAYFPRQERVAFEAITITAVPEMRNLKNLAYISDEELAWFENYEGRLMLEIAVADHGRNVPATLWKSYCDEHQEICKNAQFNIGSTKGNLERSTLHQDIVLWSFDHRSTRKTPKQFRSELALLNWRGLHRALNSTSRFNGCLILRSGQTRTGFVFNENVATSLSPVVKQHEFPGTSLTLRIPIIPNKYLSRKYNSRPKHGTAPIIKLQRILEGKAKRISLNDLAPDHVAAVGVTHPFKTYDEKTVQDQLLPIIRQIPPHIVSFHLFASLESGTLSDQLPAFQMNSLALDLGPPRLIAFFRPGESLKWKFVGIIPEFARSFIGHLENSGVAEIGDDPKLQIFADRITRAYFPFLRIDQSSLLLVHFNSQLSIDNVFQATQLAFNQWSATNSDTWLYNSAENIVLLTTGRAVKNYVSVLKILYSDDLVAQAVSWEFNRILEELRRIYPQLCIVTESEASYFIANILQTEQSPLDIFIGDLPGNHFSERPIVVFADAINKGETLFSLLQNLNNCVGVICCIDLRPKYTPIITEKNIPITALLQYPFDSEEVSLSPQQNHNILEVDAVTHIPGDSAASDSFKIGTNEDRDNFIASSTNLFRYGLHRSGGRTHIVSLSNQDILNLHADQLIGWIKEIIEPEIEAQSKTRTLEDIVFFTRNEASIKVVVEKLAKGLLLNGRNVFQAIIPVVPSGPREIFGRPTHELFHGLQSFRPLELFYQPKNFLAVYLDDACVTGKSLLNFLIQISNAGTDQLPSAVLTIPMLSRFSPAEESFYRTICKTLSAVGTSGRDIPFTFCPLFRLQIRSFDKIQSTYIYELLSRISSRQSLLDARLQQYVETISNNFSQAFSNTIRTTSETSSFQHPFYSGKKPEAESLSDNVLRIRHLISLQEQNVGVLSELLSEILYVCSIDDDTLLILLALEPDLLKNLQISRECRSDIVRLAMRAIASESTEPAIKSDAICVMALLGQALFYNIIEILEGIKNHPDLIDQFLVLLLTIVPKSQFHITDLEEMLQKCSFLPPKEYSHILGCLHGFVESPELTSINVRSEALQAIKTLIARTSIHVKGHSAIKAVNTWLLKPSPDRYSSKIAEVRTMLQEAITVVRSAILPGINGFYWWAEQEGRNLNATLAFRDARVQVLMSINKLESLVNTLAGEEIGIDSANNIQELWVAIREQSQINAPDIYLSGSIPSSSTNPPVLEQWAPEFFCVPFEIAVSLESKYQVGINITSSWEKHDYGLSVIAVPIPLQPVREVFRLLREDMEKHGEADSHNIYFSINTYNDKKSLLAEFRNLVISNDSPGSGKSQNKAKMLAAKFGFLVEPDAPQISGSIYRVKVIFPDFLYVRCE